MLDILSIATTNLAHAKACLDATACMQDSPNATKLYYAALVAHDLAMRDVNAAIAVARAIDEANQCPAKAMVI